MADNRVKIVTIEPSPEHKHETLSVREVCMRAYKEASDQGLSPKESIGVAAAVVGLFNYEGPCKFGLFGKKDR